MGLGECSVNGGDGQDFCPNFLQPFLENIDRSSCNDGSQGLNPVLHSLRVVLPFYLEPEQEQNSPAFYLSHPTNETNSYRFSSPTICFYSSQNSGPRDRDNRT